MGPWMSRALDDLTSRMRPLACELIARAAEAGIPVLIVDTVRTRAEHALNLARGASSAVTSKHLPLALRMAVLGAGIAAVDYEKSDAIDVAPYAIYQLHGPDKIQWDASDPAWQTLGRLGEAIGLRWGGRWRSPHDPGHFEWVDPTDTRLAAQLTEERARPWPVG